MKSTIKRCLENAAEENNVAFIYHALADLERDPRIADVYGRLAATEERHAREWAERARQAGASDVTLRPSRRARLLVWLARRFGSQAILPSMTAIEQSRAEGYAGDPSAAADQAVERAHALLLRQMTRESEEGMAGGALAQMEGRHRSAGGNALRAAVLGASDGLLSNFNLVMGVAGAALSAKSILITGFAGLLAGAVSMALGEWISVQSSRELYTRQIETEREEIANAPEEEIEELVLIYQARGLDEESARQAASRIMSSPDTALDALVRDELGIDPEELGGSAWEAAFASFGMFALGAIIPVIPFLLLSGMPAIVASALASACGLFLIGAAITLFTGRSVWYSGVRQVAVGLLSALATFTIGHLIGVNIGG